LAFLAVVLVMLWRPVLNVERIRERENVVAVLVDDSGSMENAAPGQPSRREQVVSALSNGVLDRIGDSSELRLFSFSDRATPVDKAADIGGGAPQTRIGDALTSVLQMAASVPVAAVVVATDGAENGGTLDEVSLSRLTAAGIPIHTIGVGPEQLENDLEIEQLTVPSEATSGETLRALVVVRHQKQLAARVRIYDGNTLIAAQDVKLSPNGMLTTALVEFPAGDAGLRDLRVVVDGLQGEVNLANNERRRLIEVVNKRHSILYVEGEPRWEYKFMRRAADTDRSLRLVSVVRATPNRFYRQGVTSGDELEAGFPTTAEELFAFDAVVIGSLEAAALSAEQHQWLRDFVDRRGGSLMLLAGRDGLGDGGWARVPVGQLLPAVLPSGAATYGARVSRVRPTVWGLESPVGRFESDPERNEKAWAELPALSDYQTIGALKPGAVVLLEAVSGQQTDPLLVTQRYGRGSTWLMSTASTWHWQMRLPLEDQKHEQFWRQLLHAVASGSQPQISLRPEQGVLEDDSVMRLEAEVLNTEFKPVPGVRVEATATAEDGSTAPVVIEPSGRGDGRYSLRVDAGAPGLYRVQMTATDGTKPVGEAVTHVRREAGALEPFGSWQHRALLERIARDTGGRYWPLANIAGLPEAIRYSRAGMVERQSFDLWNIPLLFALLALLKGGEWMLRRHWRRL
ncbi:MAG: hypothetical protein LBE59_06855, partial [Nevskiaceae bacterium]|nr:hypothetical protein [Nevskiaceae bacterium]